MGGWSYFQGASILQGASFLQGASLLQGAQGAYSILSPAAALSPGADAAFSFGLTLTREALLRDPTPLPWSPPRPPGGTASDGLPPVDNPKRLDQWSIDIRFENYMAELLAPVRIQADATNRSVSVSHVAMAGTTATVHPIYLVQRPPRIVFEGKQLQLVHDATVLRSERLQEIITQIGLPMQYWAAILDLNPTTTPKTLEFLNLALAFASYVNQPTKHYLACPRPAAYSPGIQPVINPRRFGAFPCGHAAEAFLIARLLQRLSWQDIATTDPSPKETPLETQLQRLASRISDNRVVAGVHSHIDNSAGRMVGETLAGYLHHRCVGGGWKSRIFEGDTCVEKGKVHPDAEKPFSRHESLDGDGDAAFRRVFFSQNAGTPSPNPRRESGLVVNPAPAVGGAGTPQLSHGLLNSLWTDARNEWL